MSVAEFVYSQTILLRFTLTLFDSYLDEKVMSNEQKVTSNKQKVTSNEQKVMSNKHRAKRSALFFLNLQEKKLALNNISYKTS